MCWALKHHSSFSFLPACCPTACWSQTGTLRCSRAISDHSRCLCARITILSSAAYRTILSSLPGSVHVCPLITHLFSAVTVSTIRQTSGLLDLYGLLHFLQSLISPPAHHFRVATVPLKSSLYMRKWKTAFFLSGCSPQGSWCESRCIVSSRRYKPQCLLARHEHDVGDIIRAEMWCKTSASNSISNMTCYVCAVWISAEAASHVLL